MSAAIEDSSVMKCDEDNAQPSRMQQVQLAYLTSKVESLESTVAKWIDLISNAENKMNELYLLANSLSKDSHQQLQFKKFDIGNSSFSSVCSTDHEITSSTSLDQQPRHLKVACSLSEDTHTDEPNRMLTACETGFPSSTLLHPSLLRIMQTNTLY
jgi:hypothetical protein